MRCALALRRVAVCAGWFCGYAGDSPFCPVGAVCTLVLSGTPAVVDDPTVLPWLAHGVVGGLRHAPSAPTWRTSYLLPCAVCCHACACEFPLDGIRWYCNTIPVPWMGEQGAEAVSPTQRMYPCSPDPATRCQYVGSLRRHRQTQRVMLLLVGSHALVCRLFLILLILMPM